MLQVPRVEGWWGEFDGVPQLYYIFPLLSCIRLFLSLQCLVVEWRDIYIYVYIHVYVCLFIYMSKMKLQLVQWWDVIAIGVVMSCWHGFHLRNVHAYDCYAYLDWIGYWYMIFHVRWQYGVLMKFGCIMLIDDRIIDKLIMSMCISIYVNISDLIVCV